MPFMSTSAVDALAYLSYFQHIILFLKRHRKTMDLVSFSFKTHIFWKGGAILHNYTQFKLCLSDESIANRPSDESTNRLLSAGFTKLT